MVHTEGQWTAAQLTAAGYPINYYELSPSDQQRARATANTIREQRVGINAPVPAVYASVVKQAPDRAQYVRQQKGHSLTLHLLLGGFVLWIPAIYFTASPNHYWHA